MNAAAFTPDLASSLSNLGNRYSELGRLEEALAAALEATDLRRGLVAMNAAAFTPDLAASLSHLGIRYSKLNRLEEALAAEVEATDLYRGLVAMNAAEFTPELARSLLVIESLGGRQRSERVLSTFDEEMRLSVEGAVGQLRLRLGM
jgi:tetratricopeptide (TPR) repeat protein